MLNQNWGRALGKSLDHFTLRGRACGAKWPAAQDTVNFIGGVVTPPGYGPVLMALFRQFGRLVATQDGNKLSVLSDAALEKLIRGLCRKISRDKDACFFT